MAIIVPTASVRGPGFTGTVTPPLVADALHALADQIAAAEEDGAYVTWTVESRDVIVFSAEYGNAPTQSWTLRPATWEVE